jgi:hypothetical protein
MGDDAEQNRAPPLCADSPEAHARLRDRPGYTVLLVLGASTLGLWHMTALKEMLCGSSVPV